MNNTVYTTLLAFAVVLYVATAFAPMGITTKRSAMSMRRGRGSGLKRELDDSGSSSSFTGGMGSSSTGTNWLNTKKSVKELPTEEGEVRRVDVWGNNLLPFLWRSWLDDICSDEMFFLLNNFVSFFEKMELSLVFLIFGLNTTIRVSISDCYPTHIKFFNTSRLNLSKPVPSCWWTNRQTQAALPAQWSMMERHIASRRTAHNARYVGISVL